MMTTKMVRGLSPRLSAFPCVGAFSRCVSAFSRAFAPVFACLLVLSADVFDML
jgi:hypothetical protein